MELIFIFGFIFVSFVFTISLIIHAFLAILGIFTKSSITNKDRQG
jgi:hypothetical protein